MHPLLNLVLALGGRHRSTSVVTVYGTVPCFGNIENKTIKYLLHMKNVVSGDSDHLNSLFSF